MSKTSIVHIEVEYTEGYKERFTKAILKLHEKRKKEKKKENVA